MEEGMCTDVCMEMCTDVCGSCTCRSTTIRSSRTWEPTAAAKVALAPSVHRTILVPVDSTTCGAVYRSSAVYRTVLSTAHCAVRSAGPGTTPRFCTQHCISSTAFSSFASTEASTMPQYCAPVLCPSTVPQYCAPVLCPSTVPQCCAPVLCPSTVPQYCPGHCAQYYARHHISTEH